MTTRSSLTFGTSWHTGVMLAVPSFNFIGDALRDYMDPRLRIEAGL